jgi:hypothetical protein
MVIQNKLFSFLPLSHKGTKKLGVQTAEDRRRNQCILLGLKNEGRRHSRARQWPFASRRAGREKDLAEERKAEQISVAKNLREIRANSWLKILCGLCCLPFVAQRRGVSICGPRKSVSIRANPWLRNLGVFVVSNRKSQIRNRIRVNPYLNVGRSSVRRGQYRCLVVEDEARGKACFSSGLRQEHITG